MKVGVDCALCIFQRGYMGILEATDDQAVRLETIHSLFRLLAENFRPAAVPSVIGTMRERLIKEVTGNPDPYAEKKQMSNREALRVLPFAEKLVSAEPDAESRFRKACLIAIVGNIIEFNIPGHSFEFDELSGLIREAEVDLVIDDISKSFNIVRRASLILYLTDNAGEVVLDTLLVKELKGIAKNARVVVGVESEPIHNDATMEDALFVGMDKAADSLVTMGTAAMGLMPSECSQESLDLYNSADFVVAKGMGYAEAFTE